MFSSPVSLPPFTSRLPVAAAAVIPWFSLVALDANGNAVPASDTAGLKVQGVAHGNGAATDSRCPVDNSTGAAGKEAVAVYGGIFRLKNSSAAPLEVADLGKLAVVENQTTAAKTSVNRVAAGVLLALESGHVWLWIMPPAGYGGNPAFQTFDLTQPVPA